EGAAVAQARALHVPDLDLAAIGEVQAAVVRGEAQAIGLSDLVGDQVDAPADGVHAVHRLRGLRLRRLALVEATYAKRRIGKPDTPVRMHHEIVGRIEPAALIAVGDDADPAIGFIAQHAASAVLGGQLPALTVEGVAVAVAGRFTEVRDAAVVLYPA